jgi:poly(beta-D-mannuronate) lyase
MPLFDLIPRLLLALLALLGGSLSAAEVRVDDPESARKAARDARPGDVVVLAAGVWRDADLRLVGEGSAEAPITIRAERPGETVLTGASRVRIGGQHLVVSGLWLRDLSGAKADWLEFRIDSRTRADHCRVTECAFTESPGFVPAEAESRWVGLYGIDNQVDRCHFQGKKNRGTTLVVWLGEQGGGGHRILANRFDERPELGKNGGETIRIGDSSTAHLEGGCLVEGNLFHRCDGETECISNKSGANVYRGNVFLETQGTLTLRHGDRCLVEGNVFLGGARSRTGGIRVIGSGHRVVGNHLEGLRGDGFRAAICLVNGIPESPANGYHQVEGAEIRDNLLVDCKESILIGYNDVQEATAAPREVAFSGNRIRALGGGVAVRVASPGAEFTWADDRYENDGRLEGLAPGAGLEPGEIEFPRSPEPPDPSAFGASWWAGASDEGR